MRGVGAHVTVLFRPSYGERPRATMLHGTSKSVRTPGVNEEERGMSKLFVYGTLMAPEVLLALLKRVPAQRSARLYGHARWRVRSFNFPAIVASNPGTAESRVDGLGGAESRVDGLLLDGLQPDEIRMLDYYEDDQYDRLPVLVESDGFPSVEAVAYV